MAELKVLKFGEEQWLLYDPDDPEDPYGLYDSEAEALEAKDWYEEEE